MYETTLLETSHKSHSELIVEIPAKGLCCNECFIKGFTPVDYKFWVSLHIHTIHVRDKKIHSEVFVWKPKGNLQFENDDSRDENMPIKLILQKQCLRVRSRFVWLKVASGGGCCKKGNEYTCFKICGLFCIIETIIVSGRILLNGLSYSKSVGPSSPGCWHKCIFKFVFFQNI
jgi:hypothetical protein